MLALLSLFLTAPCGVAFAPPRMLASPRWSSPSSPSSPSSILFSSTDSVAAAPAAVDDGEGAISVLSWESIRATLVRLEETIIFSLIERAQYRQNEIVYKPGGVPDLGVPPGSEGCDEELSFLDFMLTGTEVLHGNVGRYESPEEYPFFPAYLPKSASTGSSGPIVSKRMAANDLNWNNVLYNKYVNAIVPAICGNGDDEQYGSSVNGDVLVLQAISKKIHFGKFVAENKYMSDPEGFQALVDAGDADGIRKLLINPEAEAKALMRARLKATNYGREPLLTSLPKIEGDEDEDGSTAVIAAAVASAVIAAVDAVKDEDGMKMKGKVDPAIIENISRDVILPLTMDIEVAYIFLRCGKEPPPEYAGDRMSGDVEEL